MLRSIKKMKTGHHFTILIEHPLKKVLCFFLVYIYVYLHSWMLCVCGFIFRFLEPTLS